MRKSEIFDAFVKIAQEKGMVSNDSKDSKKKLEQTGRADSLDISAIEALYGVKPDTSKGMDYKKNIMEAAHPNSVVVSPSYDKLNGLVENNNERQNILLHIVQKTPDGLATQRKYAEQEFLLSLVKVANELDQKNEYELCKLADVCLKQSVKKNSIEKVAAIPVLPIVAVVAVIGGLYLQQHLPMVNDGFVQNHQKLVNELDDLINAGDTTFGVGYKYKPQFIAEMQNFRSKLDAFYSVTQKVMPIIEKMDKPKDAAQLIEIAKQPQTKEVETAYKSYRDAYESFLPYIKDILKNFANEDYKLRQIEEKGLLTKIVDAPQILHGGKGLVADDFDDVKRALTTYRASLVDIAKILREAQNVQQKATTQLQQASSETKQDMPDLDPNSPSGAAAPGKTPAQQADNKADELLDQLKQVGVPSGLVGG